MFFLLTLSVLGFVFEASACRDSWLQIQDSCYHISHLVANWPDAYVECKALGAHLATVRSAAVHNALQSELANHKSDVFWIGGTDLEQEGRWTWADTLDVITYDGWAPGEPNDGESAECMNLWNDTGFKFADEDCNHQHHYICEISASDGESQVIG